MILIKIMMMINKRFGWYYMKCIAASSVPPTALIFESEKNNPYDRFDHWLESCLLYILLHVYQALVLFLLLQGSGSFIRLTKARQIHLSCVVTNAPDLSAKVSQYCFLERQLHFFEIWHFSVAQYFCSAQSNGTLSFQVPMSKFEPDAYIPYSNLENNLNIVKKRLVTYYWWMPHSIDYIWFVYMISDTGF